MSDIEIVNRFNDAQRSLVLQSSDLSLDTIASMVASESIDVSPGYQRRERWGQAKQSALIESFLLNIPVPPIYLAETEYGKYSVIDGKQRVTAIHRFIRGNMALTELERFTQLEGKTYQELPESLANALSIRPYLRVVTLLTQSDPELKYQVFTRLNTGGDKLLPQEIRNVAFMGPLNDMIFQLAANPFLRQQLKIVNNNEKPYKEMTDAEYVLRFFTIREYWANFHGNMNTAMNDFMHTNRNADEGRIQEFRTLFTRTLELSQRIWGNNAFQRPDGDEHRRQVLQGFYDVQTVPLSYFADGRLITDNQVQQIRQAFSELYRTNVEFQDALRQFTSNPANVELRIRTMIEVLSAIL